MDKKHRLILLWIAFLAMGWIMYTGIAASFRLSLSSSRFDDEASIIHGLVRSLQSSSTAAEYSEQFNNHNQSDNDDKMDNVNVKENVKSNSPFDEFSICLIIMDDNHRLPEWIAYNYFALNLRYMVVAVDPYSKTSPSEIFDRWKGRIEIVQWTDSDFTARDLERQPDGATQSLRTMLNLYVTRQNLFYTQCTAHMKRHNRTWTAYIDTDEYLSVNEALIPNAAERMHQPRSIPQMLHELRHDDQGLLPESKFYQHNRSCFTIPRRRYNGIESTHEQVYQNVPEGFDAYRFETLRFRHLSHKATARDGFCKSVMDASVVPDEYLEFDGKIRGSPHRPIRSLCPSQFVDYTYPIGIHHYFGSLEAFLYRDDPRQESVRNVDNYRKKALLTDHGVVNDELRLWLDGFVKMVGKAEAMRLVNGTGSFDYSWRPPSFQAPNITALLAMPINDNNNNSNSNGGLRPRRRQMRRNMQQRRMRLQMAAEMAT